MDRKNYEYQKQKKSEYGRDSKRVAKKKKNKLRLFVITFFSVLLFGGTALGTLYLIQNSKNSVDTVKAEQPEKNFEQVETKIDEIEKVDPFNENVTETNKEQDANDGKTKYADVLANEEKMRAENIYEKQAATEGEVTLTFTGDVMFDDAYSIMSTYRGAGNSVEGCMSQDLLDEMRSADILMMNNECTFTTRGNPTEGKTYTFRCKPENAKILQDFGADVVSLANNHAYDFGEISLLDTLDTLQNEQIPYVGAGRNFAEASRPVYFIVGNIKIAILSATQIERVDNPDTKGATESSAGVFRCRDPKALCDAITEAKTKSDFVIVYVHWGTENETTIDWAQRDQAPMYANAGADLIIGDHPHCLQGIAYVENVPVIYSLGNFWFNSKTIDTGMLKATFDENGMKALQFVPCLQAGCRTVLLHDAEKERVLQKMRELSSDVQIDSEGYVTR